MKAEENALGRKYVYCTEKTELEKTNKAMLLQALSSTTLKNNIYMLQGLRRSSQCYNYLQKINKQ